MCHNRIRKMRAGGMDIPAVLFMNSNKSEKNIRKIIAKDRLACCYAGIDLKHEVIINKGPNRDIDRDAVNMLISLLITGQYEVVVVEKLSDLTDDVSDLEEFIRDAAQIGVYFYELSSKCFYSYHADCSNSDENRPAWDGGCGC